MRLIQLLFMVAGCAFSLFVKGQTVLEQGMIVYKIARPEKIEADSTEQLHLYFGKNAAVQRSIGVNKEGEVLILSDFVTNQAIIATLPAKGDTLVQSAPLSPNSANAEISKLFKVKQFKKKTRNLLGYECTYLVITPQKKNPYKIKIEAWVTDRIQSKQLPISINLGITWPGFPLDFQVSDLESNTTLQFKAQQINPVNDSILEAKKQQVIQLSEWEKSREEQRIQAYHDKVKRQDDFKNNTKISLELQVDSLWELTQQNHQVISLECKRLFARCYISRERVSDFEAPEAQMIDIIERNQNYYVVLESPIPAIQTTKFLGKPAQQQVWHFHNKAILDQYIFPKEHNPFDFFPMEDLVVLHRTFKLQGIVCLAVVQTTQTNFENVMQSVDHILETLKIKGI